MQYNVNTGDTVGIVRHISFSQNLQGLYEVIKVNKVAVEVKRQSDGYIRTFSNRTGLEKGSSEFSSAKIVSEERYATIEATLKLAKERTGLFQEIAYAANRRNVSEIKVLVERLESLS